MNLYVWELYVPESSIFDLYNWFWLRWNHVAGKAASPVLLLHRSLPAQSRSVFHYVRLTFVESNSPSII
jgi:hypothetical protein